MAKKKMFQISNTLTAGLEETITSAQNYSGALRVDIIPIKKIETDSENPREFLLTMHDAFNGLDSNSDNFLKKTAEIASLESLSRSIKEQGIINPIVVYKQGESYRLVAGERRTLASILAGKTEIQAKILDRKPDELKISLLQWIENIERSDLTLWERIRNIEKIADAYATTKLITTDKITVTQLSELIGCTKPHAINYKAVLSADLELKQLILENKIKNLEKAALIAGISSPEIKQKMIQACLNGTPLKKLRLILAVEQNLLKEQNNKKQTKKPGRQAFSVKLGATKNLNVAKLILKAILDNKDLSHLNGHYQHIDWNDYASITNTFNNLLKKLEKLHG